MKAVLVIDMPDDVSLDEWYAVKMWVDRLKMPVEELEQGVRFDERKYFSFVPLRPLPEVNTWDVTPNGHITEFAEGWNACLEEILGDTE